MCNEPGDEFRYLARLIGTTSKGGLKGHYRGERAPLLPLLICKTICGGMSEFISPQ